MTPHSPAALSNQGVSPAPTRSNLPGGVGRGMNTGEQQPDAAGRVIPSAGGTRSHRPQEASI